MQLNRALLFVLLVSVAAANLDTEQTGPADIWQYYGFEEMEIVKLDWAVKDLRIADFNRDGRNDMAIVNNRKARIELLIQKETIGPDETEVAVDSDDIDVNTITAPSRFARESIAVSQKLHSLVTGDLNCDGLTDMAFYGEPKGLYVILQDSDDSDSDISKPLTWRTRKKIPIDDGLQISGALVCGDLNDDRADDLALASRDGVYILLQDDDGSLGEPVKYPTSGQTLSVDISDLNGDSINDLVLRTTDAEKPLHVRFGLKTGQLGPQVQFIIEKPFALRLQDIDDTIGDEILSVDSLSGRLIGYRFATEKRKDVDWPILFYPLTSGQENAKRDLALGDVDGDGLVDVIISDPAPAELILYRQMAGLGLVEPVRFPSFAETTVISAADIDSDGKTELGVLSVKEKVIGLSRFENDRLSFPRPLALIGEPLAMQLTDINGDGKTDCLYISKDDSGARTLRAIYELADAQAGPGGASDTNSPSELALELKRLTSNPDGMMAFDADQDGLQDALIFVSYESPILVRQLEANRFEVVDPARTQASLIKDASLRSTSLAEVDGKEGLELLIAQRRFARSLVFSEGRNWSIIDQYNAQKGTETQILAVAAFRIDKTSPPGRPAILLLDGRRGQLQILKAGSDETYRVDKQLDVGKWNSATHLKMLFAPLTGSDVKSLMLFDSEKFAIVTPLGSGDAVEHLARQFSYETKIKDGRYGNLTAGDINSDGRTDIIMVDYRRNYIEILTLDEGKPVPATRFKVFEQKSYRNTGTRAKVSIEPRELKVADVTGDKKNDLVTVIHDRIIVYPQD
ncbi:MAG: VCBS repeat-containing protein [Phycisphaerales bacterium]|nr:MAG: VCBS repeat-containing protein [Phycisphaerales bacterium]